MAQDEISLRQRVKAIKILRQYGHIDDAAKEESELYREIIQGIADGTVEKPKQYCQKVVEILTE